MSELVIWTVLLIGLPVTIALIAYSRGSGNANNIPPPSPNAQWAADPTGRHELRMWDGHQWTANVSDRGVSGWDPVQ